ncbi:MAG: rhomboid family intramembrane serine protease [Verrucomicrobia bacterium]|nr:rhomboid family intramembrane serine protease [Verrucomicrobiota bacterium]
MRTAPHRPWWTLTYALMALNTLVLLVQLLSRGTALGNVIGAYLPLSYEGLSHGFVWQLISFQFLHADQFHLFFNLLAIYFFGRPMEEYLGRSRFLQLYLTSGVVGGLCQVVFAPIWPNYFGGQVVGASAGAFGLVAAFATLFPDRTLTLLLFFVVPVNMRARTLIWISVGLATLGLLNPGGQMADAAHLGGILTGFLYIRWLVQGRGWRIRWAAPPAANRSRILVGTAPRKRAVWQQSDSGKLDALPAEEFISREVDPILDKISAHGFQSLTEKERQILEQARARISRR